MSFDRIDHDALIGQVERRVCDRNLVKLLRAWLRAGVFEGGVVSDVEAGTPQGSPISPLLANSGLAAALCSWPHMFTIAADGESAVVVDDYHGMPAFVLGGS